MVSGADRPVSLAIDTSGSFCSVALRRVDGAVFHRASEGAGDHFERLSALVSELCAESGVALADVAEVVIGSGPGSFTGLRIGFSFAKGLAVARRLPIIGVSSFFGAAASLVGEFSGDVLVVADARRDEVFAGAYRVVEGGSVNELSAPCIEPVAYVASWAGRAFDRGDSFRVVTPNRGSALGEALGGEVSSLNVFEVPRVASGLLLDGRMGAGSAVFSVEGVAELEPNYLRAVAAKTIAERNQ